VAKACAQEGIDILVLPVSYTKAQERLLERIKKTKYDFILSFGLAGSRPQITLEKKAFNERNSPAKDNDGKLVLGQAILPSGAQEITNPLPLEDWQSALKEKDFISRISSDPGRYVCNEVYYLDLSSGIPCLFVHWPNLNKSSLNIDIGYAKALLNLIAKSKFLPHLL
jgi:pyroglutamyl-peptidase